MGERLSGNGVPGPGDAVSGPGGVRHDVALETVLAAVLRAGDLDLEAEQRAVATFRDARGAGLHRARTRRRDDWRLPAERRAGRPVKATFGAVFASLALGGVAVAAIGSSGDGAGAGRSPASPSVIAPARPGGETSPASSGGLGTATGPATAQDIEAHCRAYEQVKDRGRSLDATAWRRLVAAAGGEGKVAAYCSEQLARATAVPSRSGDTVNPGKGAADAGTGTAGNTGTSGNGDPGHDSGGAGNAAGNGQVSGGKDE
ncbi:hypothetical protein OG426_28700 [Streptomyces canus]|uniref:hypothetical protein n=1 Tax=Streptomyces canus TaxID=58343 RepID=UPI00386FB1D6|nr:hypothetical protein OG426_28700 [Streptomyces canus]